MFWQHIIYNEENSEKGCGRDVGNRNGRNGAVISRFRKKRRF